MHLYFLSQIFNPFRKFFNFTKKYSTMEKQQIKERQQEIRHGEWVYDAH